MSADEQKPRVLLVGLGATSLSALEGLAPSFAVVALIRGGDDTTTERAGELGVPVVSDVTVRGVRAAVAELRPDAVVVSSFNRILDADLVAQCPFVNVHYAPLPRGRGRATVNWAIINGDTTAAISIHHLVPGLDAGGVLYQETVPIGPDATVATLYDELNELQRRHIAAATAAAIAGAPGVEQDERQATYLCTRVPDDGEVDWAASTAEIHRLVRALQQPFPSAFTWLGLQRLYIDAVSSVDDAPVYEGRVPGRIVRVNRETGSVDVLTGDGVLRLDRVRVNDGEQLRAGSLVSSVHMTLGLSTSVLVEAIRMLGARSES
jgi:methionyl-tRNA formyltransferase